MPAIVSRGRADLGESRPRSNVPRGHAAMTRPVASPTSFESVRVRAPTRAWCCTNGSFVAVTHLLRFDSRHFRPRARVNKPFENPNPGKSSADPPGFGTRRSDLHVQGGEHEPQRACGSKLACPAGPSSGVTHLLHFGRFVRAGGCIVRPHERGLRKCSGVSSGAPSLQIAFDRCSLKLVQLPARRTSASCGRSK